jgi:hypothetical protein
MGERIIKGKNMENPKLEKEAIRRFQSILEEDDETDFEVVSSTKQRLDLLLGMDESFEDDDGILVISTPSRIFQNDEQKHKQENQLAKCSIILLATLLSFMLYYYRASGQKQIKKETDPKKAGQTQSTPSSSDRNALPLLQIDNDPSLHQKASQKAQSTTRDKDSKTRDTPILLFEEPLKGRDQQLATTTTHHLVSDDTDALDKVNIAKTLVKEMKLFEQALMEHGADKSLASQLAVSLQISQTMIQSQRQLETRRILIDNQQRNLDRQLSQQQHEESIQASKYDPNWSDKLERKRDMCWKATTRILLEVLLAFHFSKLLRPVAKLYQVQSSVSFLELTQSILHLVRFFSRVFFSNQNHIFLTSPCIFRLLPYSTVIARVRQKQRMLHHISSRFIGIALKSLPHFNILVSTLSSNLESVTGTVSYRFLL